MLIDFGSRFHVINFKPNDRPLSPRAVAHTQTGSYLNHNLEITRSGFTLYDRPLLPQTVHFRLNPWKSLFLSKIHSYFNSNRINQSQYTSIYEDEFRFMYIQIQTIQLLQINLNSVNLKIEVNQ